MSQPFLGQIMLFAGDFPPRNWAFCNGQLLSISQFSALFAILGTAYGGDGQTTFALPDLQGRVAVGQGSGVGLSSYTLGEKTGQENVTLTVSQMPQHNHMVSANASAANSASPSTAVPAESTSRGEGMYTTGTAGSPVVMSPTMVQPQGGNQPHTNLQPLLALSYIIALQGIFPSRN